jgi:hypothetical protein
MAASINQGAEGFRSCSGEIDGRWHHAVSHLEKQEVSMPGGTQVESLSAWKVGDEGLWEYSQL